MTTISTIGFRRFFSLVAFTLLHVYSLTAQTVSTTGLTPNQNEEGIMFDFTANQEITLNGIQAQLEDDNQPYNFNIYYRIGTYVGSENSSAGWTLLATTGTITSDPGGGLTSLPLGGASLSMTSGSTYGFYLENFGSNHDLHMHILTTGNVAASNSVGTIFSGEAINSFNAGSFSGVDEVDRAFVGTLFFTINNTNIPTMGEWGLMILLLTMLITGVVSLKARLQASQ